MINYPASCLVLTIDGNNVTLNEKLNSSESQKWIRGPTNSEGYFTIKHKTSGKFLTNDENGDTVTKGMRFVLTKVIMAKSHGEVSLVGQDTIENVS